MVLSPELQIAGWCAVFLAAVGTIVYKAHRSPEEQARFDEEQARIAAEQQALRIQHARDQEAIAFNSRAEFYAPVVNASYKCTFVTFDGTTMSVKHQNLKECKLARKEVLILRKIAELRKRSINSQYKDLRDEYSQQVGNRGLLMPGGGKIGSAVRFVQRSSRNADRARMANIKQNKENAVAPWDNLIDVCNEQILSIDRAVINYEIELN